MSSIVNVALRLTERAKEMPDAIALAQILGRASRSADQKFRYQTITFKQLDEDSDKIAQGMIDYGVTPGMRIAMLVPQGLDFVSVVFGMLKSGAVTILIDPGMGRKNLIDCLAAAKPEGFFGIPLAQAIRTVLRRRFPLTKKNVTVGRRCFWGGKTLQGFRKRNWQESVLHPTQADDEAAIIFTTGSTGPPKGVLYRHKNFDKQVEEIQNRYNITPGGIDVPGFPMFGLFNSAMGTTSVIPRLDPSRPASLNPAEFVDVISDWQANQTFASPAVLEKVGHYCHKKQIKIPTLKRILTAGAPVRRDVVRSMLDATGDDAEIFTPYGATESLPVASISGAEIPAKTSQKTDLGDGVCVGTRFPGINWRVIPITDEPIPHFDQIPRFCNSGEIGELIVQGDVVTTEYVTRCETNPLAKILEKETGDIWHRMGDVGYLDEQERFWVCGRKSHRVITRNPEGELVTLFTLRVEAIFNQHKDVKRTALIGLPNPKESNTAEKVTTPAVVVELKQHVQEAAKKDPLAVEAKLCKELAEIAANNPLTSLITAENFFFHPSFPVDIRHNAKIFREKLTVWAVEKRRG